MRVWQRMLSGKKLDIMNPNTDDIEIEDIAHGLSRVARWNGQTEGDYAFSVAQHSVLVEGICRHLDPNISKEMSLLALLHDASEYVIGDMISPFKNVLGDNYRQFEDKLEEVINIRFGLPEKMAPEVKKFIKQGDTISAYLEATQIAGFDKEEAQEIFGKMPAQFDNWQIIPMSPNASKHMMIDRYNELTEELKAAHYAT